MSDTKILLGSGILIFWVAFGFFMGYVLPSSKNDLTSIMNTQINEKTINQDDIITTMSTTISLFFKGLFLQIPNIPFAFKIIVYSLQILSLMLILFCFMDLISDVIGGIAKLFI